MQSGISASVELQNAFTGFTADTAIFCLPVTITGETLTPLPPVSFSSATSTLKSSLPSLDTLLTPTAPLYLLLRQTPTAPALIAVTYIPSRAPVRQKTLFASTRATLVRELGGEKFHETIFLTERDEVLDPAQWDERAGTESASTAAANTGAGIDTALLSAEERELQAVKRAEEEERHGTRGRDLMNEGGSGGAVGAGSGSSSTHGGFQMKTTDEARRALADLKGTSSAGGNVVQIGIDIAAETIVLLSSKSSVSVGEVPALISADRPTYTFYTIPGSPNSAAIFIYVCPGSSKVKERMLYAASRRAVLHLAKMEGVEVVKNLESGSPDELVGRLEEEIQALTSSTSGLDNADGADSAPGSGTATPRSGFARPKRPGKR